MLLRPEPMKATLRNEVLQACNEIADLVAETGTPNGQSILTLPMTRRAHRAFSCPRVGHPGAPALLHHRRDLFAGVPINELRLPGYFPGRPQETLEPPSKTLGPPSSPSAAPELFARHAEQLNSAGRAVFPASRAKKPGATSQSPHRCSYFPGPPSRATRRAEQKGRHTELFARQAARLDSQRGWFSSLSERTHRCNGSREPLSDDHHIGEVDQLRLSRLLSANSSHLQRLRPSSHQRKMGMHRLARFEVRPESTSARRLTPRSSGVAPA